MSVITVLAQILDQGYSAWLSLCMQPDGPPELLASSTLHINSKQLPTSLELGAGIWGNSVHFSEGVGSALQYPWHICGVELSLMH
jgi:hypothetical protein